MAVQFIGLGTMGSPMVRRLTGAGVRTYVTDVDAAVAEALAAETGAICRTEAGRDGDVDTVILMLPNSAIVNAVLGREGDEASLLRRLPGGTTIIDMSSSNPDDTRSSAGRAEALGLSFVDAPVSGGPVRAASGELTIMVGTDSEEILARVMPTLGHLGTNITVTGPVGSAHAAKALNNVLSVIGLVGALEVLTVGKRFGLDPRVMLDVINTSTGRNHATEVKIGQQVLTRDWNVGFSLALTVKDVETALGLARSQGIDTPVAVAAAATAREALALLVDESPDQSQIAEYLERRSGVSLATTSGKKHAS